ncbi:P-loop containing nucleoside triphosphate hydrolase protein [Marasmius fiardii PR-910]|nr:P-loop containing nucleoside triphosphate hydrolase protein [Marasmius fiardii PR-910]
MFHFRTFILTSSLRRHSCLLQLYASLLSLLSNVVKPHWSKILIRHLNVVLLATFVIYGYRDLYPLATYTKQPQDISEGPILWFKIAILALASILIPLFVPRQYIPADPSSPSSTPNAEQTASLYSLFSYTFIAPVVFHAYRVPHLPFDRLPPLADRDSTRFLKGSCFKANPFSGANQNQRVLHGLLRVFRLDILEMGLVVIFRAFAGFISPIALRELLRYLETRSAGRGTETIYVRPWVWVVALFLDPMLGSLLLQWYGFLSTRLLVRAQAILAQLVLEHSLRIRVKSEAPMLDTATVSAPSTPTPSETGRSTKPTYESLNLIGKINNLVSTDLDNFGETRDFLLLVLYVPLQIVIGIGFLYYLLGWSALVGFVIMIGLGPLPGIVMRAIHAVQVERMKRTDARVESVTETLSVIRMVKLFGWENKMASRIAEKREAELTWIKRRQFWELVNDNILYLSPIIVMIATFSIYTVVMKRQLTPSTVFSAMTVLEMLRLQLIMGVEVLSATISGKVSLDRVSDFLKTTKILDTIEQKGKKSSQTVSPRKDIGFCNAIFTWSRSVDIQTPPGTSSLRRFSLKINDELVFRKGCVNLVLGETGSGKTSLLMALLSEMCFIPCGNDSWYSLPREEGVAYAAQEPWVQNESIRGNIVFGSEFDEERYKKVLYQCGLERDISLFETGDATEVGEKGLTLSGGQKARVALARAIYSNAGIVLLDDPLAALDVHTAKWIVEKCLQGDLVEGRTVILVAHNVALARPIAGFVVSLKDGCIMSQGTLEEALENNTALKQEALKDAERLERNRDEEEVVPKEPLVAQTSTGKLIVEEEIQEGHVGWVAVKAYLSSMGSWPFFVVVLSAFWVTELLNAAQTWFLGYWASQYEHHDSSEVSVSQCLTNYLSGALFLSNVVAYGIGSSTFIFGAIRASRIVHERLVQSVLGTTLRWLDTTPVSRIIARCTQDIRVVDGPIVTVIKLGYDSTTALLVKFFAIMVISPIFFFPGFLITAAGMMCGQIFIKAQLPVKREMSNARAPVLGHVGATIAGLVSIRAYGVEERFVQESMTRIDKYTRVARTFYTLNRWVGIRMNLLAGVFASCLGAYLVYGQGQSASNTGFSLNMAIGFSVRILYWIRNLNDFEVQGEIFHLERIYAYLTIEQEPKSTTTGTPPAYWPASGDLRVENLSAKYSLDGPRVLHDLNFEVRSGERVGVVGRTGSGKASSLTLSLLRCIFTEGRVYYDGIPIDSIDLEALRSNITIIPQIPELLSGTLRQNLDPFEQHDDVVLHNALRSAGLYSLQGEGDEGRLTLEAAISSGGTNLSVGQRQIIALARALVRGSKLLILDEATSAIDYETDSVIQASLRTELPKDVTVITVAHRLQSIMDADKILVLDAGRIVEFGAPQVLLEKEDGMFRTLVNESNDRNALYSMVKSRDV